ncbi:S-layer homology domain-containing protein [Candidatus Gracilibacteria bacterium]|nr:S-layer homology domain-containing protein [Candidatus Gracilibacteria bacterium]MCF7856396.1 S-layer homology domain-containing protein [Candidatus Gracilibacteria bacterium]
MNSFKKFTAALAALAVTMTSVFTFSVAVAATTFTDASSIASWSLNAITSLADDGVLAGRPDGSFDPQGQLNRAEVAKVAVLAAGLTSDTTGAPHFNDVAASDWFYSFVETLYNNGVVGGINGGALDTNGLATYNPAGTLNRAEGSKILVDAFDMETAYAGTPPNFPDVASSAWFYDYVETAYAHGILNGYDSGNFGPSDAITREQIAVIAQNSRVEAADASQRRSTYTAGAASSVEPTEPVVTPTTSDGSLTVAKSASTPAAATFPNGASSTAVAAYDFTATGDDVTITNLTVKRTGVGVDGDWILYVYDGTSRLTSGKSINSTSHEAVFNALDVTVAAGTTKTLILKADTSSSSTGGESYFEITAAASVTSNAKSVGGSFPVTSNKQEINTSVTAGTATIIDNGSITNPKVGEDNITIGKFKITTANEAGLLKSISLIVGGSISATDVQNAKLYQGDTLLASVADVNSKDLLVFDLATPYEIAKGDSRNFEVKADLNTGRTDDTIQVYLDEDTDLEMTGGTYGFGMDVTATGYDASTGLCDGGSDDECNFSTVQGGDITISSSGPSATEISINGDDLVMMNLTITSVAESTFKKFEIRLVSDAAEADATDGLVNTTAETANYTDIKIINADTGAVLMGPIDSTSMYDEADNARTTAVSNADSDGYYDFRDEFTMSVGEELNLQVTMDVANNSALADEVVYVELNMSGLEINDSNNKAVTISTTVVPTGDITGKSMTVAAPSLTVTKAATPVSDTFVKGTKDIELLGLAVAAGSASDAKITEMVVRIRADDDTTFNDDNLVASDYINNIELWVGDTKIAGPEGLTLVGTQATGYYKATFDDMNYKVEAGSTIQMTVKGDLSSSASAGYIGADIDPNDDITSEDEDGNSITAGGTSALNGAATQNPVVTVATSGTLTVAEEDSPNAGIIIGGAQGVTLGQYKFTAANEAQTVKDFTVEVTGTTDVTSVSIEYEDKAGATITNTATVANDVAAFTNETLYVGKDKSSTLIIKANLNSTSAGAISGDSVKLSLGTNAITSFKAVGEGSGTTDTTLTPSGDTNTMVLRKTAPTIAKATGLSTTLTNGQNTIYGFTIAADAVGAVSWRAAKVKITGSIALDTGQIDTFKFFRGTADVTDDVQIVVAVTSDGAGTVADDLESTSDYFVDAAGTFDQVAAIEWNDAATSKETISAGSSKTYYLKADVSGAATNDSISAYIVDDTAAIANVRATDLIAFDATKLKYVSATGSSAAETTAAGLIYDRNGDSAANGGSTCTNASDDITLGGTVSDCGTVAAATITKVKWVNADAAGDETDATSVFYDPAADSVAADGAVCTDAAADDILLTATTIADCAEIGAVTATKLEIAVDGSSTSKVAIYHDKDGDMAASNGAACTAAGDTTSLMGGTAPTDCEFFTRLPYVAYPNLLWSDQSVTAHTTSTADWTNGYLVSDMATASATLTK